MRAESEIFAHGKQISSDVATSFFTLAAVYARGGLPPAVAKAFAVAALATAGGLASKFTSVLLVPIVLALGIVERMGTPAGGSAATAPVGRGRGRRTWR